MKVLDLALYESGALLTDSVLDLIKSKIYCKWFGVIMIFFIFFNYFCENSQYTKTSDYYVYNCTELLKKQLHCVPSEKIKYTLKKMNKVRTS